MLLVMLPASQACLQPVTLLPIEHRRQFTRSFKARPKKGGLNSSFDSALNDSDSLEPLASDAGDSGAVEGVTSVLTTDDLGSTLGPLWGVTPTNTSGSLPQSALPSQPLLLPQPHQQPQVQSEMHYHLQPSQQQQQQQQLLLGQQGNYRATLYVVHVSVCTSLILFVLPVWFALFASRQLLVESFSDGVVYLCGDSM
jgi:hypothetical protein